MLIKNSCHMLLAMAATGALAEVSQAGCNCSGSGSVPPSPAAATGMAPGMPWGGMPSYGLSPGSASSSAWGTPLNNNGANAPNAPYDPNGPFWAPGGYEPRVGSPMYYHDPAGGQYVFTGNPYYDHFGPGFHRGSLYGHYRYPYYNYRAPWYYPGTAVYNRDTNFPW